MRGRSPRVGSPHFQILKLLIKNGATWTTKDVSSRTALHWAAMNDSSKCVAAICKKARGTDVEEVNSRDVSNFTAMHWCAVYGKADHIKLLLKAGADPAVADGDGKTSLHWAVETDVIESIYPFTETASAFINMKDNDGRSAIHIAVSQGNLPMVQELCAIEGVDSNVADVGMRTPLHWAAAADQYDIIQLLLDNGADPFLKDETGAAASHYAAQKGENTLAVLLAQETFAHEQDNEGRYPAHWAVMRGELSIVKPLLKKVVPTSEGGVDAMQDSEGRSLLHFAVASNVQNIAKHLLKKHKADPNVKDSNGQTPLSAACENGFAEMIALLCQYNADVNLADNEGRTPLHWVAVNADQDSLEVLFQQEGLDFDAQDESGKTSLAYAAYQGHGNVVMRLCEAGAAVNTVDNDSVSPLHWAASEGYTEIVQILLNRDAYSNYMDQENKSTAFDYAVMNGQEEIAELIAEYGGLSYLDIQQLAVLTIQTSWRGHTARAAVKELRTAKFIGEATKEEHKAATLISAQFRGFSNRKKLPQRLAAAEVEKQEIAATKIQALVRGNSARKRLRQNDKFIQFEKKMTMTSSGVKARKNKPLSEVYNQYIKDAPKRRAADRVLYTQLLKPLGKGLGEVDEAKNDQLLAGSTTRRATRMHEAQKKMKIRLMTNAAKLIQQTWNEYQGKLNQNKAARSRPDGARRKGRPPHSTQPDFAAVRADTRARQRENDAILSRMGVNVPSLPSISPGGPPRSRRTQSSSRQQKRRSPQRNRMAASAYAPVVAPPQPANVTFALRQWREAETREARAWTQDTIRRDARQQSARFLNRRQSGGELLPAIVPDDTRNSFTAL